MKKRWMAVGLVLLLLCQSLFAASASEAEDVANDPAYEGFDIKATQIHKNEETGEITFKNECLQRNGDADNNTYVINAQTIVNCENEEMDSFLNGELPLVYAIVKDEDYFLLRQNKEKTIPIAVLWALSSKMVGVGGMDNESAEMDWLTAYRIMQGDENKKLHLDREVTRAEMAQLLINSLRLGNVDIYIPVRFSDVPETHWAKNAVGMAYELKFVNGVSSTLFCPDDTVLYEDALKMIVSVLGYAAEAEAKGGYPDGYIQVAEQKGVTKRTQLKKGDILTRRDAGIFLTNSLSIPLMKQVGFGSNPEYMVCDGENGAPLETLEHNFKH